MTDAHCHLSANDPTVREFLIGRDFFGTHPWEADSFDETALRAQLLRNPGSGVGEIGLDRLRERTISDKMRAVFRAQLRIAFELKRPIVLHGAKCWGQVVEEVKRVKAEGGFEEVPLLFHGFSRSEGLIPEILKLKGFISVGPAILNDHAVNYRQLAQKIPLEALLLETDRTSLPSPTLPEVASFLAGLLGLSLAELESRTDANASKFWGHTL